MIFHLQIFGRGFAFMFRTWDPMESCTTYASIAWLRRGSITCQYSFRAADGGGLEFMVRRKHTVQGWRLRGPVEHFNY